MPELPEVETLRRELDKVLKNKKVKSAQVLWPKTIAPLSITTFKKQIKNKIIGKVERQAKILIVNFTSPRRSIAKSGRVSSGVLAFHLKMTGQLIYEPKNGKIVIGGHPDLSYEEKMPNRHTRLILEFTDQSKLYFNDLRKFGWARLVNDSELKDLTKNIGLEPLSKFFTDQFLIELFKKYPNRTIKQILLDQTLIAGLGNIYADESAFLAKLMPNRKASTVKPVGIKNLREAIVDVLKLSLRKKGTSSRNYRRSNGQPGGFVPFLNVYGRTGKPCKTCETTIKKIRHASRGTHFCPKCQKETNPHS
jgi:formamidopyrimidine-DNA glycosylase